MPELRFEGISTRPLVGYLKALGLLRIVGCQAERAACGRWNAGRFELTTELDRDSLLSFLLEGYAPTPVVSPWNGGSGFYPKDERRAIDALEAADDRRFADYAESIRCVRALLVELGLEAKPETTLKPSMIQALRARLPDAALEWLDAAVVKLGTDLKFPPLLGSGGNDGRYDFSNNFAQAACAMLLDPEGQQSSDLLGAALDGGGEGLTPKLSLAHFFRDESPVNSPQGKGDSLGNPWDLILAVEGVVLFTAAAARRHQAIGGGRMVAPFTAAPTAAGFGSAASGESGRREVWLPIWRGWALESEIAHLVREGRAQVGRRAATTGLDFVRASGKFGVDRGIEAFERYAILERAGQSSLTVPAGRISVGPRPSAAALDDLAAWLERLLGFARGKAPRAAAGSIRSLERSVFEFADRASPESGCEVLVALGQVESALARSGRSVSEAHLRPPADLEATPWMEAADDASMEFTVACGLASLTDSHPRVPRTVRDYLHGTANEGKGRRYPEGGGAGIDRLAPWWHRLAAIHVRRHLDARAEGRGDRIASEPGISSVRTQGLGFDHGQEVPLTALHALARGSLDGERALALAGGLSLFNFRHATAPKQVVPAHDRPFPLFDLLALAWHGAGGGPKADWAARLRAGALASVVDSALLALRFGGRVPLVSTEDLLDQSTTPAMIAAALLIRPAWKEIRIAERTLTDPSEAEELQRPQSTPVQ